MAKYKLQYILVILLFIGVEMLHSQTGNIFYHIKEDMGLSSKMCFSIQQDKRGYIWISTKLGIDRFDGKNIKSYFVTDQAEGYERMGVNYLRYSPDSIIWAFSESGLVFRYDEAFDRFDVIYSVRDFFNDYNVMLNDITFVANDKILLATTRGIVELDINIKKATLLKGTEKFVVYQIAKYNDLYSFATSNGLYIVEYKKDASVEIKEHHFESQLVLSSYFDVVTKKILVGTLDNGLHVIHKNEPTATYSVALETSKPIRSIIYYAPNEIAVGVDLEGVFIIDRNTLSINKYFEENSKTQLSIASNNIRGLFVDKESNLWVATYHGGVSYQSSKKPEFKSFIHENNNSQTIGSNIVNSILEDSDGDLWFGTNNGVSFFDKKRNAWKHYFSNDSKQQKGDAILAICEDSQKNIWIGGYSFGVACIDKHSGRIDRYTINSPNTPIATNYIYSICRDGDQLLFGGIMGNLTSYDVKTKKTRKYDISKINAIAKSSSNRILLGLFNGLFFLDKETGELVATPIKRPVASIFEAENGLYWIAVRDFGFYCYNSNVGSFKDFSSIKHHLSSSYIYTIISDKNDNLWISTENGLNKFSLANNQTEIYDKQDGLLTNQFNARAYFLCKDGNIILGSPNGAIEFDPKKIKKNTDNYPFTTIVHQFDLFNEPLYISSEGAKDSISIFEAKEIDLAYNKNFFSFYFSTPNFQLPQDLQYSYFLEGHDLDWSIPSTIDRATYSRVSPGNYIFRVCTIINGERYGERNILIHISKPWWNTWWARIIYNEYPH